MCKITTEALRENFDRGSNRVGFGPTDWKICICIHGTWYQTSRISGLVLGRIQDVRLSWTPDFQLIIRPISAGYRKFIQCSAGYPFGPYTNLASRIFHDGISGLKSDIHSVLGRILDIRAGRMMNMISESECQ